MNNKEVIDIAKECGLVYNSNHEILDFYQKVRSSVKKEYLNINTRQLEKIEED